MRLTKGVWALAGTRKAMRGISGTSGRGAGANRPAAEWCTIISVRNWPKTTPLRKRKGHGFTQIKIVTEDRYDKAYNVKISRRPREAARCVCRLRRDTLFAPPQSGRWLNYNFV